MKSLVFLEERGGVVTADSLGVLSHVAAQCANVAAVVMPAEWNGDAANIGACGAKRLFVAAGELLARNPVEPRSQTLARLCSEHEFDMVIFAGSVLATDLAARIAGQLDAGIVWNITELELAVDPPRASRSVMANSLVASVEWQTSIRVALMRQRAFEPVISDRGPPQVIDYPLVDASGVHIVSVSPNASEVSVSRAEIVVSAGRGIGKRENLALVEDLAEELGGAVGVSLPLVEAGWAPRSMQIGQTGTIVQPKLYVACGISGQFQHWLGMERSETIVAINTDPEAPMMKSSDIAIVGDVKDILPRLVALLRTRRNA